ncbi:MAG: methyltransferase domain-containing protein [Dehalococcoidia bacterium]|nr:methyltransferase domain-containing protein [Dehalococcoidia bacterium]
MKTEREEARPGRAPLDAARRGAASEAFADGGVTACDGLASGTALGAARQRTPPAPARVEPDVYTGEYYLTHCHGHEDFLSSRGRKVGPRFIKALSLAGELRGRRVLDVGCGRGELVLQSALRGADAWGVDYASAAIEIAQRAVAAAGDDLPRERLHLAQTDVQALAFADASFDVVFMMDIVEHLHARELAAALREARRVLRPGGALIVHTSPNRVVRDWVYPYWVRHVNKAALAFCEWLGYRDALFNRLMLPTGRDFPEDDFERAMHVNEQTAPALRRQLTAAGLRIRSQEFWEPPMRGEYFPTPRLNGELRILDFVRFLRPLSLYPPLNRYFCHHIWMTAERA